MNERKTFVSQSVEELFTVMLGLKDTLWPWILRVSPGRVLLVPSTGHSGCYKCLFPSTGAAKSPQSCPTLCDPRDSSPPGSVVPGILQARTLEWVCHYLLQCMKVKSESEVARSCPTLSDPMDCSLPGSSVHGSLQARVLEWGAITFSDITL